MDNLRKQFKRKGKNCVVSSTVQYKLSFPCFLSAFPYLLGFVSFWFWKELNYYPDTKFFRLLSVLKLYIPWQQYWKTISIQCYQLFLTLIHETMIHISKTILNPVLKKALTSTILFYIKKKRELQFAQLLPLPVLQC